MMEALGQIISIPVITLLVYSVLALYNRITYNKKETVWRRLIPLWAFLLGIFLAIFVFSMFPEIMPAPSLFTSIMLGAVAGLAATGLNQLMNQLFPVKQKAEEEKKQKEQPTDKSSATESSETAETK